MIAMTSVHPEWFGMFVGLIWVVLAIVMAFRVPYRGNVPHKYSNGFFSVGAGMMLLGYTSFSWAGVWALLYGLFLPLVLLVIAVTVFRWVRREYLPGENHVEITP